MAEKIKLRPRALGWEYLNKIENPLCALGFFSGHAIRRINLIWPYINICILLITLLLPFLFILPPVRFNDLALCKRGE